MRLRPLRAAALAVLVVLLLALPCVAQRVALVASGMKAKSLCSGVCLSGRDAVAIEREDLVPYGSLLLDAVSARVDRDRREVEASMFGIGHNVALYREGLGRTLTAGVSSRTLVDALGALSSAR